jgi:hypothetical protein
MNKQEKVFESFEDFSDLVDFKNAINEAREEYTYTFVANKTREYGTGTPGFASVKSFNNYSKDGYFDKTDGYDKGMSLSDWTKTKGFKECESEIYDYAADEATKKSLERFKETFPEKYNLMVMYMTHAPIPRSAVDKEDKWTRFSPLGKGGGGLFGKDKGKVYATEKATYSKPVAKPEEIPSQPSVAPNSILVPVEFPESIDTSAFFKFNSWEFSDEFKKFVSDEIIKPTVDLMKSATPVKPSDPKAFLQTISVDASCSTIPNKTSPDGKKYTFVQLAQKRAEAAVKYISDELKKAGVLVDDDTKATIKYKGENEGKKVTKGYGSLVKNMDLTGTSGPEWDGANTEEVKKFQRVIINLDLMINSSKSVSEPSKEKEPSVITQPTVAPVQEDEFKVVASFGKFKFELPPINIPNISFSFLKRDPAKKSALKRVGCAKW